MTVRGSSNIKNNATPSPAPMTRSNDKDRSNAPFGIMSAAQPPNGRSLFTDPTPSNGTPAKSEGFVGFSGDANAPRKRPIISNNSDDIDWSKTMAGMAAAVHHHPLLGLNLHQLIIKEEVAREQGIRRRRAGQALLCPIAPIEEAI